MTIDESPIFGHIPDNTCPALSWSGFAILKELEFAHHSTCQESNQLYCHKADDQKTKILKLDGDFDLLTHTKTLNNFCMDRLPLIPTSQIQLFEADDTLLVINNVKIDHLILNSPYVVFYGNNVLKSLIIDNATTVVINGNFHADNIFIKSDIFRNNGNIAACTVDIKTMQFVHNSDHSRIVVNATPITTINCIDNKNLSIPYDLIIQSDGTCYSGKDSFLVAQDNFSLLCKKNISLSGGLCAGQNIDIHGSDNINFRKNFDIKAYHGNLSIHATNDIQIQSYDRFKASRFHVHYPEIGAEGHISIISEAGNLKCNAELASGQSIYINVDRNVDMTESLLAGNRSILRLTPAIHIISKGGYINLNGQIYAHGSVNLDPFTATNSAFTHKAYGQIAYTTASSGQEELIFGERKNNWFQTFINHTDQKQITGRLLGDIVKHIYTTTPKILDIGCGEGSLASVLLGVFKNNIEQVKYIGLDNDEHFLDLTKNKLNLPKSNTQFVQKDCFMEDLSLLTANLTIASHIAYYTNNITAFVENVMRTLPNNGIAVFVHEAPSSDMNMLRIKYMAPTNAHTSDFIIKSLKENNVPYYNAPISEAFLTFPSINIEDWKALTNITPGQHLSGKLHTAQFLLEFIVQRPLEALADDRVLGLYLTDIRELLAKQDDRLIIRSQITLAFKTDDPLSFLKDPKNNNIFNWSHQNLTYLLGFPQNYGQPFQA